MGNEKLSRRAVISAGQQAMEALEAQRELFLQQQKIIEASTHTVHKLADQVTAMRLSLADTQGDVDFVKIALDAEIKLRKRFEAMRLLDRLWWAATGMVRMKEEHNE